MSDLERQWTEARGHQERHPIRVRMELVRELGASAEAGQEITDLLGEGRNSEDPLRAALCEELAARWLAVQATGR